MYPDAPVTHTTFPAPVIAAAELIAVALCCFCCVAPEPDPAFAGVVVPAVLSCEAAAAL